MKKVFLVQAVRRVGGSGSEMIHLCRLFRRYDVDVTCVTGIYGDEKSIEYVKSLGVHIQPYPPDGDYGFIKDQTIISHGNPQFTNVIRQLKNAKPNKIYYISPMWTPASHEYVLLNNRNVDGIIHVSNAQRNHHKEIYKTKGINNIPIIEGYLPYIEPNNTFQKLYFNYKFDNHFDYYGIGRIQRPDALKFHKDMWTHYRDVKIPNKRIVINGWDGNITSKVGAIPSDYPVITYNPYEIDVDEFYGQINLLMQASGEGESLGRFVLEAMLCGVPCILENNGLNAFNEIGNPGEHFVWAKPEYMADEANELYGSGTGHEIAIRARRHIEQNNGNAEKCWEFWKKLL